MFEVFRQCLKLENVKVYDPFAVTYMYELLSVDNALLVKSLVCWDLHLEIPLTSLYQMYCRNPQEKCK